MDYKATIVFDHIALEPPPTGDEAENFVMQLVQGYIEGHAQSAHSLAAPHSVDGDATFERLLRKPGWFRAR